MNETKLDGQPCTIAPSTTPNKLARDGEPLYHVKLTTLPGNFAAQYWMTELEVISQVSGVKAAIGQLQQRKVA